MHAVKRQQHQLTSREFQRKLYRAAKRSRTRRFHALYDRIYRPDILWRAWAEVKANRGDCGIDNASIEDIEKQGATEFLETIAEDLKGKRYRPKPVRRVYIPKPDGRERPLGIPTVRDRVVQQACRIVIEPVFEALFEKCSYGFRPKRNARQAVSEVKESLIRGWHVVDADIEGYFDNIDHEVLLSLVARRISDRRVLKLIRQWLKAGSIEKGQYSPTLKGTPQGGVISPLLANIYLHVLDRHWVTRCSHLGKLIRYCDDFVIICRTNRHAQEAMMEVTTVLEKLKLALHQKKTRIVEVCDVNGFDFLGYHFCKLISQKRKKLLPYSWPSKKALKNIRNRIHELTEKRLLRVPLPDIVRQLNPVIRGWRNYFSLGNGSRASHKLDDYVWRRLRQFYFHKMKSRSRKIEQKYKVWVKRCGVENFYVSGEYGCAP